MVAIVVLKLKLIVYLDSLHGINRNLLRTILNYVKSQHLPRQCLRKKIVTSVHLQTCTFKRIAMIVECMFACTVLDSKSARNRIATKIISEPEEKLKHEKLDSKQRSSSFLTTKWSENFVVNRKSPIGFISSKHFVKAVSSSLFIGRYSLCALQSSCKKPSNKEMIFCNGDCRDWYHKKCLSISLSHETSNSCTSYTCPRCS